MAHLVVGVTGKKRAGKDTFARRLIKHHGFTRLAFADALKAVMTELDPVVPVHLDETGVVFGPGSAARWGHHRLSAIVAEAGWEKAKEIREVRRLLQVHGVSVRTHADPEIWVGAVRRKAEEISGPVVITDVRFPNEAEYVQASPRGQLVRIERSHHGDGDTHISETALDGWPVDAVIPNHASVSALHRQADKLVQYWYNAL